MDYIRVCWLCCWVFEGGDLSLLEIIFDIKFVVMMEGNFVVGCCMWFDGVFGYFYC